MNYELKIEDVKVEILLTEEEADCISVFKTFSAAKREGKRYLKNEITILKDQMCYLNQLKKKDIT